ncbi:MAG: universal stress protein, partial [Bacteroidota bacterium]
MMRPKNILVPTDLSFEADQALGHAIFLARLFRADVHLLHVMPKESGESRVEVERVYEEMEAVAARRLGMGEGDVLQGEIMLHAQVLQGFEVVGAVLAYTRRIDADLVVMGTRGRRAKDRPQWQSHAEEIARLSDSPVLTVGRDAWSYPGVIQRVLVPVALRTDSEPVLSVARRVAHHQNAELDLLHVVRPSFGLGAGSSGNGVERQVRERRIIDQMTRAYRNERGPGVRHRFNIRYGEPSEEIVRFAQDQRSHLIIVNSRGHVGVQYALDGSHAAAIIGTAGCPVLTLKTNQASAAPALGPTRQRAIQQ